MKLQEFLDNRKFEAYMAECPEGMDPVEYAESMMAFEDLNNSDAGTVEAFIEAYDKEVAEFGKVRIVSV